MITNYTSRKGDVASLLGHGPWGELSGKEISSLSFTNWWKICALIIITLFSIKSNAQTVLIDPATVGGFENGTTFAANGWTVVNGTTDGWAVGNAPVSATGANCAYVSANGGAAWTYSQVSTNVHLYRDVTIPAGETKFTLSFKWKAGGEGTTTSDWDNMKVWFAPTSFTPVATAAITTANASQVSGPGAVSGMYKLNSATWNSETITVVGTAGVTYRLIFSWKSDVSDIANPPVALDDISFTTQPPGNFVSIASGNWNATSTWDGGVVPSSGDHATISAGHVVSINAANQAITNLTVNGTLDYTTTPTSFSVIGNLNVGTTGVVNAFSGTTGKTFAVAGNVVNNGTIDASVGTTTAGNFTLYGSGIQTVSGTGNFGANNVIRNLTFQNTNTTAPSNIVWQINDVKVAYNLSMTGARVNLGTNKMTFGYNAAGNTLTAPVGTGFTSGKFSRYWSATATGTAITAGTEPTGTASRYPFLTATGASRAMYITRTNTTGAIAGELAVTYNDASGITPVSIADGAYNVSDRFNGNWSVSNEGTAISSSSYTVVLFATGGYAPLNGNSRVIGATAALSGTHQNGTASPIAQRITVSQTDLLAGPLYVGIASSDVPFTSIASGDWNQASTWNKGSVPACADVVNIASGFTVTSNSAGNVARNVSIATGGVLIQASGDLTVGCTLNNNTLVNSGTLTVSGGTLNVNGSVNNVASSIFNQSGGDIIIDGNNGGVAANSVPTGTNILRFNSNLVNLTGGKITVVDPHVGTSSTDYSVAYNNATPANASTAHTLQLGNGVSVDPTTNTAGFMIDPYVSTARLNFGNVIVNTTIATTNRFVAIPEGLGIHGDLTINSGNELRATGLYLFGVSGNIINNGTLTSSIANLALGGLELLTVATLPNPNPQSVSGSGVFRNSATAVTANLANLIINNASAAGVTLNVPISISGTLTLTNGVVNTTSANLVSLGTATAAGTLVGGSATAYVNGPFARSFATRASAATYDQTTLFPVGKGGEYLPLNLAPTTTAAGVKLQAEAFDTNTGTIATGNVLGNKRWEVQSLAGSTDLTNVFVKETEASILATGLIAQAPSASGLYTTTVPTTAVAGSLTSTAAIATADFTGFLSFAHPCVAPAEPTGTATQVFCASGTVADLTATVATGNTYVWYDAATAGNLLAGTDVLVNGSVYYAAQIEGNCESATRFAVTVTLTPRITPDFAEIGAVCSGSTAPTLATTSPNGVTGTWSPSVVSTTTGGTYVFTPTAGLCANTQTLVVTITTPTTPNFAEIGAVCSGSTAPTLATTSPNGVTGTWSPSVVSTTTGGTYVFTPTAGLCANTQSLVVTITAAPATPTGASTQNGTTLADLVVAPATGILWYANANDAGTGNNALALTTPLVNAATYYAVNVVGTCRSAAFPVLIDFNLATATFSFNNLKFYPNPVKDVLTVSHSEAISSLKLYNLVGQQVLSKTANTNEVKIDVSALPFGTYLLEVSSEGRTKTVKVIKN